MLKVLEVTFVGS